MKVALKRPVTVLKIFMSSVIVQIKKWTDLKQIIDSMTPIKLAKYFLWMISVVIVCMVVIFGRYYFNFNGDLSTDRTVWGTFGDYIGGTLNPILSFLSLIALLTTIVLQSKELELTRNELELTRDELKRSASAQEDTKKILDKQSETLARQQFESTFFSMLDQHNKVLESLTSSRVGKRGTAVSEVIEKVSGSHSLNLDIANRTLKSENHLCGHYFRVLYQLLKFVYINIPDSTITRLFEADEIKNNKLSDDEKMYTNIVRSFLGYEITQLLSINCFCKNSDDTYWLYKRLIERYSFLEHMPFVTIDKDNKMFQDILGLTIPSYDIRVFGDNEYVKWYNINLMRRQKEQLSSSGNNVSVPDN